MKNFEMKSEPPLEIFFAGNTYPCDSTLADNIQTALDNNEYGNGKLELLDIKKVGSCLEITISRPFKEMIEGKYKPIDGEISLLDALIFSGYMNHELYTLPIPHELYEERGIYSFWINMLVPEYNGWVDPKSWVRGLNVRTEAESVTFIYDLILEENEN